MFELQPDSDGDIRSETLNSSKSSVSCDSCSSASRLSFDAVLDLAPQPPPSKEASASSSSSPETISFIKPHRSSDSAWEAIRSAVFRRKRGLSFRDFKLIRRIGSGDIGHVYLCCLRNGSMSGDEDTYLYAMKVVDKEALALKKKITRAETEKRILKMLDHPFLPTLYADFEALNFSCVVMEFCSGGDLHSLRHQQPGQRFSLTSARFYAAEVLVALEYLHMLGIVYRDLKPENILVRSDGHIMLSDFDLSLCADSIPSVHSPDSSPHRTGHKKSSSFSCLCKRFFRSRKIRSTGSSPNRNNHHHHEFVAEPVSARSYSFVGTHEYVSPEVASGKSHGNAVDWWALGIFIYELIYGRTPFSGDTNEATLRNILKKPLAFPKEYSSSNGCCELEMYGRDLISRLLVKDPETRLGSKRGAADVKTHPFFKGLNFALIRSFPPPGLAGGCRVLRRSRTTSSSSGAGSSGHRRDEKKTVLTAFDYF